MNAGYTDDFGENILYVDNHLLAVNKESGLLTQPAEAGRQSLEDMAKAWIKDSFSKPGNVFLNPVHRLDRMVSGIVLFARTSKALSRLNRDMRGRKIKKTYLAIVSPPPASDDGVLNHYLAHSSHKAVVKDNSFPGSKEAVLSYKTVSVSAGMSLIEISLETGRYHQIRAQFGYIGSPVLGDTRYNSKVSIPNGKILLHHLRIVIIHPTKGSELSIEAPVPMWWGKYVDSQGASALKEAWTAIHISRLNLDI
jgi:23S rRNA pseudouridine1911/1915/1917 synthase